MEIIITLKNLLNPYLVYLYFHLTNLKFKYFLIFLTFKKKEF